MDKHKMVKVYRAAGELEAQVIKGILESEGIPVLLQYESVGRVYGLTVDGIGEVSVMVWEEMADKARELISGESDA